MVVIPDKEKGEVMMALGCLHDIAEKTNDQMVKKQIADVDARLKKILQIPDFEEPVIPKYFQHSKDKL